MRHLLDKWIKFLKQFTAPKTEESSHLQKYNIAIVVLILFIFVWGLITYNHPHPQPTPTEYVIPFVNRIEKFAVSPKEKDFVEGEFIGIRYFEIYGVIH